MIEEPTRDEQPQSTTGVEAEAQAARMIEALELVAASGTMDAREAQRHIYRVQFAVTLLQNLRTKVSSKNSVFASGRIEIGVSILESDIGMAAGFIARAMAVKRAPRPVRDLGAAVDAAVAAVATQEAKAA